MVEGPAAQLNEAGARTCRPSRTPSSRKSSGQRVEDAGATIRELSPKVGISVGPRGGTRYEAETIYKDANKQLQELRFQERKIRTDANISRANRGMLLEENHKQQQAIMRNANRDYRNIQPVAP
jgi:hypothetical protein